MKSKLLIGVQLFALGILITTFFHIWKLIADRDLYFSYYSQLGSWASVRYAFSWFQRVVGLSVGLGLLWRMDWARIAGIMLGMFTMVTIYWKHPYAAFHKHMQFLDEKLGELFQGFGFQNITFESLTVPAIIVHCLLDISFWLIFIYYMTRPAVRASFRSLLKGIHYRNPLVYESITRLLLGKKYSLRFEIAASQLVDAKSVLDVCGGTGQLKNFLPKGCSYSVLDASPEFISFLNQRSLKGQLYSLEQIERGEVSVGEFDAVVMIISLCQARGYNMDKIINNLKKMAKKCVIVEDVKERPFKIVGSLMNYCCSRDYYRPSKVFTRQEFELLMSAHGFSVNRYDDRYSCAIYESSQ